MRSRRRRIQSCSVRSVRVRPPLTAGDSSPCPRGSRHRLRSRKQFCSNTPATPLHPDRDGAHRVAKAGLAASSSADNVAVFDALLGALPTQLTAVAGSFGALRWLEVDPNLVAARRQQPAVGNELPHMVRLCVQGLHEARRHRRAGGPRGSRWYHSADARTGAVLAEHNSDQHSPLRCAAFSSFWVLASSVRPSSR